MASWFEVAQQYADDCHTRQDPDEVEGHVVERVKAALPLCSRRVRMGGWTFRCVRERGHQGRCQA